MGKDLFLTLHSQLSGVVLMLFNSDREQRCPKWHECPYNNEIEEINNKLTEIGLKKWKGIISYPALMKGKGVVVLSNSG